MKCLITFLANIIGVFIVKFVAEKLKKEKLWLYQATAKTDSEEVKIIVKLLQSMCEKPTPLGVGWIALLIFNNFVYVYIDIIHNV